MKDAAEVVTPEPDSPQYRRLKQSISDGQALLAEARPSASDLAGFSESSDETWKKAMPAMLQDGRLGKPTERWVDAFTELRELKAQATLRKSRMSP